MAGGGISRCHKGMIGVSVVHRIFTVWNLIVGCFNFSSSMGNKWLLVRGFGRNWIVIAGGKISRINEGIIGVCIVHRIFTVNSLVGGGQCV